MNIHIDHKGKISEGIERRLKDLLTYLKANQDNNQYSTKEMSAYDYSVLKGEIEHILEYFED